MILYFSGTGNSRLVAERLAAFLGETLCSIDNESMGCRIGDGTLGIVCPVYAWGLPRIVEAFIKRLRADAGSRPRYVWAVFTCGDDIGYTDTCLDKALRASRLGAGLDVAFSVAMPNTYVCLPGFTVDTPEVAARKVEQTLQALPQIAGRLKAQTGQGEVVRGACAWLKTYVLRPLFNAFLVSDKPFRSGEACTGCTLCAQQCPTRDIRMDGGRPIWLHRDCTQCLRCFHQCPQRAIDWGSSTEGKLQKRRLGRS